ADEQFFDDRTTRPERVAEVEAEHSPEPRPELHHQWLIQPEPVAHVGELLGIDLAGRVTAEDQERHVARYDPHDYKNQRAGADQRGNDQEQALGDVRTHARCSASRISPRTARRPGASGWRSDSAGPRSSSLWPSARRSETTRGRACSTRSRALSSGAAGSRASARRDPALATGARTGRRSRGR